MFETVLFPWKCNIFNGRYVILKVGQCWLFTCATCTAVCFVPVQRNFTVGNGVAACVNQWEIQKMGLGDILFHAFLDCCVNSVLWSKFVVNTIRFWQLNFFFANFYSNVTLKRKFLVLTWKSMGKMFSIMIPTINTARLYHVFSVFTVTRMPTGCLLRMLRLMWKKTNFVFPLLVYQTYN